MQSLLQRSHWRVQQGNGALRRCSNVERYCSYTALVNSLTFGFLARLRLAFAAMIVLVLVQAAIALWLVQTASYHEERSRLSHDMLNQYIELSANKQRLKVWFAQFLLVQDPQTETRDLLLMRIERGLAQLKALATTELERLRPADSLQTAETNVRTLATLGGNLSNLRDKVLNAQPTSGIVDAPVVWREMLNVFDVAEGRDVRLLLASAIEDKSRLSAQADADADKALLRARIMVAAAAACTVILALILVMYFSRRLRQPVAALSRGAAALQTEHYEHRIPEIGDYEFRDVARRINMMAAEIEQHRQREIAERDALEQAVRERTSELELANSRLAQVDARRRQLFAELSHELRTPATAILGEAEIALRGGDKAASIYRDSMTVIAETTRQLSARVAELFMLARRDDERLTLHAAPVRINDVVEQAIAQATALSGDQGPAVAADVMLDVPDLCNLEITTDRQQLLQCLMVLYDNAVRYSPSAGSGGRIATTLSGDTAEIAVTIADNGIGINAAESRDAFTRHYRGEAARRLRPDGAGLGLSIAQRIAQALGGTLTLMQGVAPNGQAQGTVARLVLPRHTQSALSS